MIKYTQTRIHERIHCGREYGINMRDIFRVRFFNQEDEKLSSRELENEFGG